MKHIILLILLTVGVWAQEVGMPYVDTREAVAQSAALSPDGETFYTYANNTLTHWSLNPVKVLERVKIEDEDFSNKASGIDIFLLNNKIVFTSINRGLGLFDLTLKKFIQKKYSNLHNVKLLKDYILSVDSDRTVMLLDKGSLGVIKKINIDEMNNLGELHDRVLGAFLGKNETNIIILTGMRLIIVNTKTFSIEKEIKDEFAGGQQLKDYGISIDQTKLYNGSSYLDLNTYNIIPSSKESDCLISNRSFSETRSKLLVKCKKINELYDKKNLNKLITIYFFNNGNWLISTSDGYFDGSYEARKYLYVKTSSGESVPIDDIRYNKFHKQINLKD